MNAVRLRIREVLLFERPVTLRMPFRFGAATLTHCPQAFVRVEAEVNGHRFTGATAELMAPKWFDKAPELTHEQNFEQLREALRIAREAYLAHTSPETPWRLSDTAGRSAVDVGVAQGLPRLAAQYGPALLDKAVADAALRSLGADWVGGVRAGALGDPHSAQLALQRPTQVALRHTVGLADRITADDPGIAPGDGLPATLDEAIARQGLRFFKIKLSGRLEADIERLSRIALVLDRHCEDWHVTLDGNENFDSTAALGEYWQALSRHTPLKPLLSRTLLLEQPLARKLALGEWIAGLGITVPVILDESDDHDEALDEGLALGYRGISTKSCKGLYRSLRNAARVARSPRELILSGEDLTCQAGLAVQQDTLLAASLGIAHIERNGHHYVDGFGVAPLEEALAFARAHPGLYDTAGTRPRLAVRSGRLDISSLHVSGFASAAMPHWASLAPIH